MSPTETFKPNYVFNNNMVLQSGKPVNIYGVGGNPAFAVTVTFNGQTKSSFPDNNGKWLVTLSPMPVNALGQTLTITHGNSKFELQNIVVGEVWYCSGQSNMAMTFNELLEKRDIATNVDYSVTPFAEYKNYTNYSNIRIYHQAFNSTPFLDDVGLVRDKMRNGWFIPDCVERLGDYSPYAVGFALKLQEVLKLPVGIIVSAVGGSSIEEWLSNQTIEDNGLALHYTEQTKPRSRLYNGMSYPLNLLTIAGLLWYQGCADSGNDKVNDWYNDMLALCAQFRNAHGNVSILSQSLVQYNENANWSLIRQANFDLMKVIDDFYAVNGIDFGMPNEKCLPTGFTNWIHPADKYGISKNAAEIAITNVYGKSGYNSVAEYPVSINAESGNLVVYYKDGVELKLSTGTTVNNLEGFVDGDWEVIENATVNGNKITVSGGAKYSKIRYANYNVMMQGANKLANSRYNSESPVNLFSQKQGCQDLSVFPFREFKVNN